MAESIEVELERQLRLNFFPPKRFPSKPSKYEITVGVGGVVTRFRKLQSSEFELFDKSAEYALRQIKLSNPTIRNHLLPKAYNILFDPHLFVSTEKPICVTPIKVQSKQKGFVSRSQDNRK